jgi:hypothetical protein
MNNQYQQLNEGLRPLDLENLISDTFEVDVYRSKMGEDKDVCVLSFVSETRFPARDLMEFIEKGYPFVLDADVSSGENTEGKYHIFVELSRTEKLAENIKELLYGVEKLTGIKDFKFKYHKRSGVYEADRDSLKNMIPDSVEKYNRFLSEVKTESVKQFFNKTLMDDLTLDEDIITIYKPFGNKIQMKWLQDHDHSILEGATDLSTESTAEIFWLTKVLGDYDISKYGDKFLFTNGEKAMLLQRTEQ